MILYEFWQDHRLKFPEGFSKSENMTLSHSWKELLWTPDTYFANAPSGHLAGVRQPTLYYIFYNQTYVLSSQRVSLDLTCDLDFTKYPFDTQTCYIEIASCKLAKVRENYAFISRY